MEELNNANIDISQAEALELAQRHLAGQWNQLAPDDVQLNVLSGGWCSRLYICENGSDKVREEIDGTPNKFLIRLYGGKLIGVTDEIMLMNKFELSVLFYQLGELDLGAKLLGVFEGGRLEEYIPSRTLSIDDLANPELRRQVARKLARIHSLKVPINKKHHPLTKLFRKSYATFEEEKLPELVEVCRKYNRDPSWAMIGNWQEEMDWIDRVEAQINGRVVMSINDLNRLNCLVREKPDRYGELVTLIDVELGSLNYRGYDLMNHFVMWTISVQLGSMLSGVEFPSNDIREEYARNYLDMWTELNGIESLDPNIDTIDHLMMEIDFAACYVLNWFRARFVKSKRIQMIKENETAANRFLQLAEHIMKLYEDRKGHFIKTYGHKLSL